MSELDAYTYKNILTRIMNGNEDYLAMLSCYYVPVRKEEKECA